MSKKEYSSEPIYYGLSKIKPKNRFWKIYAIILSVILVSAIVCGVVYFAFFRAMTPAEVIDKNASAVVAIETYTYGDENILIGTGSGFIVDGSGYIVTNEHVINKGGSITVYTKDGKDYSARIVGSDAYHDVAVIKIFSEDENYRFPTVTLGRAEDLFVGERVVVIGTPKERAYGWTSTVGYVSSAIRHFLENGSLDAKSYIQFDAAVNGGNSGGPVFDSRGRAVGIVEKKVVESEGIGLAIPVESVSDLIFSFIDDDRSKPQLGIVGVSIEEGVEYFMEGDKIYVVYSDEESGLKYFIKDFTVFEFTDEIAANGEIFVAEADGFRVSSIMSSSGAYGILEVRDLIIGFDGIDLVYDDAATPYETIIATLATKKAGDVVEMKFIRNGETKTENIRLTPKN